MIGALLALAVAARVDPFGNLPDGVWIDGILVGAGWTADDELHEGHRLSGDRRVRDRNAHGGCRYAGLRGAIRLRDGTLITGGGSQTVVFEMGDGAQRAVTVYSLDTCMTGPGA